MSNLEERVDQRTDGVSGRRTNLRKTWATRACLSMLLLVLITACVGQTAAPPTAKSTSTVASTSTNSPSPSSTGTQTTTTEATPVPPTATPVEVERLEDLGIIVYINSVPYFVPYEGTTPLEAVAAMCAKGGNKGVEEDPVILKGLTNEWLDKNNITNGSFKPGSFFEAMVVGKDGTCAPSDAPDEVPTIIISDVHVDDPNQTTATLTALVIDNPDTNYSAVIYVSNDNGDQREVAVGAAQVIAPNGDLNIFKLGLTYDELKGLSSDVLEKRIGLAFAQEIQVPLFGSGSSWKFLYHLNDPGAGQVEELFGVTREQRPVDPTATPGSNNGGKPPVNPTETDALIDTPIPLPTPTHGG